ncbi:hypothetical protein [Hymenobacter crusticola]|uniref:DUF2157 domain-containing protein n=1 Tax=Hymenobacter crusticola TaxID=1770526 RepID=A0A243W9H4_9BACT|nr:hypothetical protein [Hymenobacter crusticola]OUJ72188.1 hypothetical protein BXP70_19590 [Hymenobacter crusticola]
MIGKAYNPAWAYAEAMHAATARWSKLGLLTPKQREVIEADYPLDYHRPHMLLRIGQFIFTVIAGSMATGIAALWFFSVLEQHLKISVGIQLMSLIGATASFLVLEGSIKSARLYHSGSDNALLYMGLGWVTLLLGYLLDSAFPNAFGSSFSLANPFLLLLLLPMLAVLLVATIRYADWLVAVVAYFTYLLLIANVLLQFSIGRLLLPFALMGAAFVAYTLLRKLARRTDYLYYKRCFGWLKASTLTTFYLGGNYLVVREGNATLAGLFTSVQIPFAPLFYILTAVIPLVYLVVGLRRPDRIWLWVGLLAVGFSCYTLRYYRSLLPPEVAATLAGVVLVTLSAGAIRYLRTPRHGLTAAADEETPPLLNLESLIVAQTASVAPPPAPGFQFGGGNSGGGGATGNF